MNVVKKTNRKLIIADIILLVPPFLAAVYFIIQIAGADYPTPLMLKSLGLCICMLGVNGIILYHLPKMLSAHKS